MLLSVSQISEILRINPETVRRWIRDKKLVPSGQVGRAVLIPLKELVRFVNTYAEDYTGVLMRWLQEQGIPYALETFTERRKDTSGSAMSFFGTSGSNSMRKSREVVRTEIVLTDAVATPERIRSGEGSPPSDPTGRSVWADDSDSEFPSMSYATSYSNAYSSSHSNGYPSGIRKEKIRLAQLRQKRAQIEAELARIDSEITICEKQIEVLELMSEHEVNEKGE